ncbi:MAG: glycoside hydrolase family 3 C-terminal domain-containing protein [Bacteroidales bacterium]|nr:glycoside hydrolase family 3 C-terminal domain-containing protein [Bacteroidales bacterium]
MKKLLFRPALLAIFLLALAACGPKWEAVQADGYQRIEQRGGATLGVVSAPILEQNGYAFKDLNRNGALDPYEDWRKPAGERARDLAAQLSIEEIAGLMLYSSHQAVPSPELTESQQKFLADDNLRHVLVTTVASPEVAARWNNNVQAFVEERGHGIPANNSSDPRNETAVTAEYNAGAGGQISLWPTPLGLAATFDPDLVRTFGDIASKEYRALGIATALSPQIDLATEPRWNRFVGTFGEDPDLDVDMARAYVDGFQTTEGARNGWGAESVNAMVKHWPSGGPEEGGRDAHFNYGKYAVYPGNGFADHLRAFVEGAFRLDGRTRSATAVMPYYTISTGIDPSGKNAGNSYSQYIIGTLLRDQYKFDGVVCTDWGITHDNARIESFDGKCWGMETLSVPERHFAVIQAGVDQFGGNNDKGPILEAYRMWCDAYGEESARARFEQSAVRLLMNIFRTGLFENPYVDPAAATALVGNPSFMRQGYDAQLKSVVLLKNHESVLPQIPDQDGQDGRRKVYVPKRHYPAFAGRFGIFGAHPDYWDWPVDRKLVEQYYEWADTPAEADFALVMIQEPYSGVGYDVKDRDKGGNGYVPISLQYLPYTADYARAESLGGGDPKESFTNRSYRGKTVTTDNVDDLSCVIDTRKAMGDKPVVVVVSATRPFVPAEFEPYADAILTAFGVQHQAILDLVSGAAEPSGLLPMQLPEDMRTVEEQCEDVPHDMRCYQDADGHRYDFAFGLDWNGVIDDARTRKYRKN